MSVDLLLITWNRSYYLEKMITHLLSSEEDFNIYWWDNASTDKTRDIFNSTIDQRIKLKYSSDTNVGQKIPTYWFFENAKSKLIGKIDDDIIFPNDWVARLSMAVNSVPNVGMLGGWVFLQSEWSANQAEKKKIEINGVKILRRLSIQGHSFLGYKSVLKNYLNDSNLGFPIDQNRMSIDGYINGTLIPPIFLENMDDPRSEHFVMPALERIEQLPFTYRKFNFQNITEYSDWIHQDSIACLASSYLRSLKKFKINADISFSGKFFRKIIQIDERLANLYWK